VSQLFHVYELELDEPRWGGRGAREIDPDAPIRFKGNDVGWFIADGTVEACTHAAEALGRPGKFVAYAGTYHKIKLGAPDTEDVQDLKDKVRADRERERDEANRCRRD
jgi:hypothetical protein